MDLRQIRYFVAVYEEGSFSRAADREHCTQPGISVQIGRLEAQLGHKLFERLARGVAPTVAGRHFYACCTSVLNELRSARQRMLDLAGSVTGSIRIGVPPTLCLSVLPRVLPQFLAKHPYVDVHVAEAFSGTLTSWVVDRHVDLGIVTEPSEHLGLNTMPFIRDELLLVSSPAHHRRRERPRRWVELRDMNVIVSSSMHSLRKAIDRDAAFGTGKGRIVEVDGMMATLELVASSDWVTVLPILAVSARVARGELKAERFAEANPTLDFHVVHIKDEPVAAAAQELLAGLREQAAQVSKAWLEAWPGDAGPSKVRRRRAARPRDGAQAQ